MQIKGLESEREILIASNKSLAEFNLTKEPLLRQARQNLTDVQQEALKVRESVEEKKKMLGELVRQKSVDTTLALLQTAYMEVEEESENLAQAFLKQEITLDAFITEFIEKKKLAYLRRIKAEKMEDFIRNQSQGSTSNLHPASSSSSLSSGSFPVRPAPPPPNFTPGMPPYPVQGPPSGFPFNRSYY